MLEQKNLFRPFPSKIIVDMKKTILWIMTLMCYTASYAQVTNEGTPNSAFLTEKKNDIPVIIMPTFDLKEVEEEDAINDSKGKPFRFGYEFAVDLGVKNAGVWDKLPNGDKIWRISILSKGAKTLNFIFDSYVLPDGASVYLYNDDQSFLLGAYTSKMNNDSKSLGTWIADGEKITIEYNVPAEAQDDGELHIGSVVHGYRSIGNFETHQKRLNDSGPCNLDVNCEVGRDFDPIKNRLKRSVALILSSGSDWCTGTLINNTSNNKAPYILTANHCSGNEANWSFRFNWVSTNTVCATTENSIDNSSGNYFQTTSGATVLANNTKTDMRLIEVTGGLDDSWNLEWAGWDRTGVTPDFVVGIHHPSGDIMKICRENQPPTKTTINFNGEPITEIWRIADWDLGVTEKGSSGSAIFDENGRIVGQLAGGLAACNGTDDNNTEDWYGRFDISWDFGTTYDTRLSDWLDPEETGQTKLDMISVELGLDEDEYEDEGQKKNTVEFYPNPTGGIINLTNNTRDDLLTYNAYDITGKKVSEGSISRKEEILDFSSFDTGVYFLKVINQSGERVLEEKIMIRR